MTEDRAVADDAWTARRNRWIAIGYVIPIGLAAWLTSRVWGGRPPAGDDVMGHLVRIEYGIRTFVAHFRLDGWFPRFMAGHQEFLLYGPGFVWVVALVRGATLGALSPAGAMKVVAIGAIVVLGPATGYLARSFGLSRRAAVIAATLAYTVNNPFGVGLQGTFGLGEVPQQVAVPLFCFVVGSAWRLLDGSRRRSDITVAVIATAALIVTHPITLLVTMVVLGLALGWRVAHADLSIPVVRRLGGSLLLACGLTGWWLVPYLAHWDLRGPVATWTTQSLHHRVRDILAGRFLVGPFVGWAVVGATVVIVLFRLARRPAPLAVAVAPLAFLLVGDYSHRMGYPNGDVGLLLENRGEGLAALLGLVGLAFVLDGATDALWQQVGRWPTERRWMWSVLGDGTAAVVAVALVVVPFHGHRLAKQQPKTIPAMAAAAAMLHTLVPPFARFAVERDFPDEIGRTGVSQPNLWLAYRSGRNEVNVFNGESSASAGAGYVPDQIHNGQADIVGAELAGLGVTHLVTVSPQTFHRLAASPRFVVAWVQEPLAILGVLPDPQTPSPATLVSAPPTADASVTVTGMGAEHPRWSATLARPSPVTIALAYSPKWHASIDGHAATIHRVGPYHLLGVDLPAGRSRVALDYRPDTWDRVGVTTSAVTLLGLAAFFVRRRVTR